MLSEIISLLLMMTVPMFLYLGLRARMKQEAGWKKYLFAAGAVFLLLIVVTKI